MQRLIVTPAAVLAILAGCAQKPEIKDYARPLPPGVLGLRKINDPRELPDLKAAWNAIDESLSEALERSRLWMQKPSSRMHFPAAGIAFETVSASLDAFARVLATSTSAAEFERRVLDAFDVYTSVGWDGRGTVFYTGYCSPVFQASRRSTVEYRYPLYTRPPDLVTDPATGATRGRRAGNQVVTYPTRAQIEESRLLEGQELVWLKDRIDAYMIHVNGSAKLVLTDGTPMYVGYAGNNGHEYTSIGKLLIAEKKVDPHTVSLQAIQEFFRDNPGELDRYLRRNDRFVFFQEYQSDNWPAGSLGFKVTPFRSLAIDKSVFPRGALTLVVTRVPVEYGGMRPFSQFMLDQDTGGAIRAAGRGDIYMGIGPRAELLAGRQSEEGRLYYFFLKHARSDLAGRPATVPRP